MQIHSNPVSRVYAEALFRVARNKGVVAEIGESLQGVGAVVRDTPEFRRFLRAPMIETARKKAVVESVFHGRIEDLLVDFLCLLIDKDREDAIEGIVEQYRLLADREAGRMRVGVRTAQPLSEAQRQKLESTLRDVLQHECLLDTRVEPELIGGMVLRIGDKLYDGSVRRQLQRFGDHLMRSSGYED